MENFKQIAEGCLAGKLSGTFVLRCGNPISSKELSRNSDVNTSYPYVTHGDNYYTKEGNFYNSGSTSRFDIINFIPDMKKEQITINIPEGMEAVQEIVDGEIRIKFVEKEKKLTYEDIVKDMDPKLRILPFATKDTNTVNDAFFDKVNTIRKLTNIRNYFGKPDKKNSDSGWVICINGTVYRAIVEQNSHVPVFAEKEHAEQAIKMLGDELKYLFEPW